MSALRGSAGSKRHPDTLELSSSRPWLMDHGTPGSVCPRPSDHATSTNFTNQDLRASEVDLVVKMSGVLLYLRVGNEHMSIRTTESQPACLAHIAVSTHRLCIEHVSTRTKKAITQPFSTSPCPDTNHTGEEESHYNSSMET